jgi:hypothetical protein
MSGAIIILLAAVFLLAAASKLRSPGEFGDVLRNLVPAALVRPLTLAAPLAELALGVILLSGLANQIAVGAAMAMLAVFTIVLTIMWRRGLKGCGCFGEAEDTTTVGGIIRNVILMALAGLVVASPQPAVLYGPDFSTGLGRVTVAAGAFCFWQCLVALVHRRKYFLNFSRT